MERTSGFRPVCSGLGVQSGHFYSILQKFKIYQALRANICFQHTNANMGPLPLIARGFRLPLETVKVHAYAVCKKIASENHIFSKQNWSKTGQGFKLQSFKVLFRPLK